MKLSGDYILRSVPRPEAYSENPTTAHIGLGPSYESNPVGQIQATILRVLRIHNTLFEMATLAGKVVVVTGAASGIGRATATLLAERSALLSLSDVNEAALASVKTELEKTTNAKIFTSAFDVRNQEATHAWIRDTVAHYGQPVSISA
jgi:5,10-methylene-tetrahydrofolate dehydrogenase/methenyl tetrahydrofolate cyclohydrolase